ncbi:PREDICTED: BTB/POZ domain-containing protein At3g22104 [Fragaria vesca subsp. vesca]|uniref:BTB/POZ domain-containing protein At3g22104 n=1 Tax=Fragaria vesca subsp. vesca TaxID=101020 RepID=UPI0002C35C84|nr:PREDICTED: BTB/POZ domain-containing protein At3g22104 [Fragaria vesca subsp. vesca]
MEACCDLEVDVNGEESFMVNKRVVSSYSGKLSKLLGKSKGSTRNLKVVFQDFPGGAECFELISRFCYNNGSIDITPSNISLLHFAAIFMEMNISVSGAPNLFEKTEKSLEEMRYWTWSELLITLKRCQDLLPATNCLPLLEKCLDCIVGRLALTSEASPCPSTSSPDSSGIRFSCDTRSTESLKTSSSRATWWFEDLLVLGPNLVEMLVKSMVTRKFDHVTISRFLFYYQKSKFYTAQSDAKRTIAETVIDMLHILDQSSVSCKTLFWILRVVQNMNINKSSRNKLESMIGSQLDQASLDNLLVPSPHGINHLYDVNLVLRVLNSFLRGGTAKASPVRLRKVGVLVDMYTAEVAPDPCLRPSKFLALAMALPDAARDSYDELYRAIDMYLEVHGGLSEEEKMKLCCLLNYEKLSQEVCIHLSQNAKFPSKSAVQALISQQVKLKSLLQVTSNPKSYGDSPFSVTEVDDKGRKGHDSNEQCVLYAGKLDISADNEKLREHLHGMQWRVMELEKMCKKMQTQMAKFTKSRVLSSHSHARSLPKLCS